MEAPQTSEKMVPAYSITVYATASQETAPPMLSAVRTVNCNCSLFRRVAVSLRLTLSNLIHPLTFFL
jgi:hypothetical protein